MQGNNRKDSKIFCIGFHKTATTSLAVALEWLGYRVTGPNGVYDPNIAQNVHTLADSLVGKYDAFRDNPWPVIYREMDAKYPGSKFILTVRDSQSWISSQVRHFGKKNSPMRKWIYGAGCPQGNEALYLERYERHNNEVAAYFKDRPADFMKFDPALGEGWEKLCMFLGEPVPDRLFPRANEATDRESKSQWRGNLARAGMRAFYRVKNLLKS